MKMIKKHNAIGLFFMGALALTSVLDQSFAGICVFIGIAFFIFNLIKDKKNTKLIKVTNYNRLILILLVLAPVFIDIIGILLANLFLPDFITHLFGRVGNILTLDKGKIIFLIVQTIIASILEEIGWRGFFQKQVSKALPIIPTLLLTSFLFSIGHFSNGNIYVVLYDVFFVFLNSMIYGIIYSKTDKIWLSSLSHIISNLFGVFILLFI